MDRFHEKLKHSKFHYVIFHYDDSEQTNVKPCYQRTSFFRRI